MNKDSIPSKLHLLVGKLVYVAVIVGPLMNIPQILKIWIGKNPSGISLPSWIGFICLSFIWLLYGIDRKESPIIFGNIGFIIAQTLVVTGTLLYR